MDVVLDALKDGLLDTLELVPFLFLTYLAMEALEHASAQRAKSIVERAGASGPIWGAVLGAVPQCGFSAMAATLFSARVITLGTLVAVILSTSDEMLPVFLADGAPASRIAALVGAKVAVGLVAGLAIDAVARATHHTPESTLHIHELCERDHCHCDDVDTLFDVAPSAANKSHAPETHLEYAHHDHAHHGTTGRAAFFHIVRSAAIHTVQVTAFVLVITLVLDVAVALVGEGAVAALAGTHPIRAIIVCALIGLIPNCGASVALSELFLSGTIGAGPAFAGLLVSGGVGFLVLYRTNQHPRQNIAITALVWGIGVVCGVAVSFVGITW